ncbi:MAG: IMP dehydrogenase [Balneola sp.]|jgi:IMP dehydrogenase|nr:IMP dehydrogenase [Balneola sp.]MBE79879.1 IMP dehydrogenase [Balneola sp.]HBX66453.1 IMP dehydrogenase [Balneolaceae bacterium]|tara:strand:- start:462 stop:1949 length:1488 start_codon:yes stop_codon:yes gene_type:complete
MYKMNDSSPFERITRQGLTYDDVLLVPNFSKVLPRDVDTTVQLTPTLKLNIPIISAAMDTVSEYRLAIALAREGGIAMLHKNMSIEDQAEHVRLVKRSESGMIVDPVTLKEDATVREARALMKKQKIGGIPIVDDAGILVGIVTNRDLRFESELGKKLGDIMTYEELYTAKEGTNLKQAEQILQHYKVEKLPIVDENNKLVGLITFKDIEKKKNFPNACKDEMGRLRVGAAVGVTADTMDRVEALVAASVDAITVDTAHGHSKGVLDTIKKIKQKYPDLNVIGGNIATRSAAEALAEAGADVVKVGVGPGSICTTRVVTGVGVPQLSAVMEVAEFTQKNGIGLIADGGIKQTGDIPKAIAGGADAVMMGSMFAGVDESPGETIIYESRKYKSYRGMGSISAMNKGSKDRYFQDVEDDISKLVPEGIEGRVPFKGYLGEVVHQMAGGLRAAMGYAGAANIDDMKKAEFVQISAASYKESHPHSVQITKEAPNYSVS